MDVSWISRYFEEEERYKVYYFIFILLFVCFFVFPLLKLYSFILFRLFFGSNVAMNVESIRIISNNLNLEKVIGAITALDNIISKKINAANVIPSDSGYVDLLSVLFVYIVSGKKEKKWNEYIFDTFHSFVQNKIQINIDIRKLAYNVKDEGLLNLIFYNLDIDNKDFENSSNLINLIRPQIFKIFDNVQQITIRTEEYGFSLFGFLSLIENTKINKARISGDWIKKEFVDKVSSTNFKLEFKKAKDKWEDNELIITRL